MKSSDNFRKLILSRECLEVLSTFKVATEAKDNGNTVVKGGSLLFSKGEIPDFQGSYDEAILGINEVFIDLKMPYFASIFINLSGDIKIRIYRISESFEPERYGYQAIKKEALDELKKRFDSGHKISGKDDFYNDLFVGDETETSLTSDELIYVLSLDTKHFDMVMLEGEYRTLKIHVTDPEDVRLPDTIALVKKFRPEGIDFENGWISMWFD